MDFLRETDSDFVVSLYSSLPYSLSFLGIWRVYIKPEICVCVCKHKRQIHVEEERNKEKFISKLVTSVQRAAAEREPPALPPHVRRFYRREPRAADRQGHEGKR